MCPTGNINSYTLFNMYWFGVSQLYGGFHFPIVAHCKKRTVSSCALKEVKASFHEKLMISTRLVMLHFRAPATFLCHSTTLIA